MLYVMRCHDTLGSVTASKSYVPRVEDEGCEIFRLTANRVRRFHGEEHIETVILYPGYIFLECDEQHIGKELATLHQIRTRFITYSLSDEATHFLLTISGDRHHIYMSRGIVRNGRAHVTEGPLVGYDDRIVKIDRHKRLAWVKIVDKEKVDTGRMSTDVVVAGLELYEKV
ncbi:MAG: hypothetical protein LUH14_06235 [Clostridiaceae bacterium]|nr:hypothetical protein [Clostridiaceae bacterium]